jgi:hypothetical protein
MGSPFLFPSKYSMNCLDLISRSMKRIGVLGGDELPRENEAADALESLKGIYRRLINEGAFGAIRDVYIDGDYDAAPGQRLIGDCGLVTLPDRATDLALICIVDPQTNQTDEYLFDARTQKWRTIDDLDMTSDAPLSARDPLGLACYLAVELADEYSQTPTEMTVRNAARFQMSITHNWSAQEADCPSTVYF